MASRQEGKTGDGCDRGTKRASVYTCCSAIGVSGPGGGGVLGDQVAGPSRTIKALPALADVRRAVTLVGPKGAYKWQYAAITRRALPLIIQSVTITIPKRETSCCRSYHDLTVCFSHKQ